MKRCLADLFRFASHLRLRRIAFPSLPPLSRSGRRVTVLAAVLLPLNAGALAGDATSAGADDVQPPADASPSLLLRRQCEHVAPSALTPPFGAKRQSRPDF